MDVFWSKVCFGNHRQHYFPTSLHSLSENSIGTCHNWIPNFAKLLLLVSSSTWNQRKQLGDTAFCLSHPRSLSEKKQCLIPVLIAPKLQLPQSLIVCSSIRLAMWSHQIRYLLSPFLPQIHRFLFLSLIQVVHFVLQFHCLWLSEDERFL